MLVCFKTDAYESIIYFAEQATVLLKLMGQTGVIPGALIAKDMPSALANLHQALDLNPNAAKNGHQQSSDQISLRHRALPLIGLLEAAIKKHKDVLWAQV